MPGLIDALFSMFQPRAEPSHKPAGKVTPVMRTELEDVTDPMFVGSMVTSPDVTEADIDASVLRGLMAQAVQDDLVEERGRLIGLRVVESRPVRQEPQPQETLPNAQ